MAPIRTAPAKSITFRLPALSETDEVKRTLDLAEADSPPLGLGLGRVSCTPNLAAFSSLISRSRQSSAAPGELHWRSTRSGFRM